MLLLISIVILIIAVIAIYLFFFKWSVGIPDYLAAKHYRFGKTTTDGPISGKRVLVIPRIDNLIMVDTRIQRSSLDNLSILTEEHQKMSVAITIIWKTYNAAKTIENIKPENIESTLFQIIESAVKNECSKLTVKDILEKRGLLEKNLSNNLSETTNPWGIVISSVNILNLTVINENFIKNMALPKEIELEKKAKLAKIEEEQIIQLKTIEKDKNIELLKIETSCNLEKSNIELRKVQAVNYKTEQTAHIEVEADKVKTMLTAEAEGLLQKIKVMNSFSPAALNYELLKTLPDVYKNISMGDVTVFENTGTNENGFNFISNLATSVLSIMKKNRFENNRDAQQDDVKKLPTEEEG